MIIHFLFIILFFPFCLIARNEVTQNADRPVTIAILVKDKAQCLPLYLDDIEKQTYPQSNTYLYIRTNDNNDNSAEILKNWIERVKDKYLGVYFDDSDAPISVKQYVGRDWNCTRFKVLGQIRQESINWAYEHNSHYFVADCDNFIYPHTIEMMVKTGLPIVAPLLHSSTAYSNFHAAIDDNGYYRDIPLYLMLVNQEIKGLVQVPVVHCTYLVRYEVLDQMCYDDESYRFEYVIFSDNARKKEIPQYLDTRDCYGYISFAENGNDLVKESWFLSFTAKLSKYKTK